MAEHSSLRDPGRADFVAADLDGSAAASRELAESARALTGGRIDILVNNAGILTADGTLGTSEDTVDRALEALTRAWSAEFGARGVRFNAISPGVVLTPSPGETAPHPAEIMMKGTPHGSTGTPDAIGLAAVYLASDESSFVHGTVLDVDGGRTGVAVIAS